MTLSEVSRATNSPNIQMSMTTITVLPSNVACLLSVFVFAAVAAFILSIHPRLVCLGEALFCC